MHVSEISQLLQPELGWGVGGCTEWEGLCRCASQILVVTSSSVLVGFLCCTMLRYVHQTTVNPEVHIVRKAGEMRQKVIELTGIHMSADVEIMPMRSSENFLLIFSTQESHRLVRAQPSLKLYAMCSRGVTKQIKQGLRTSAPGPKNRHAFRIDCGRLERTGMPRRETTLSTAVKRARLMGTSHH
jgi:hypothetical protein